MIHVAYFATSSTAKNFFLMHSLSNFYCHSLLIFYEYVHCIKQLFINLILYWMLLYKMFIRNWFKYISILKNNHRSYQNYVIDKMSENLCGNCDCGSYDCGDCCDCGVCDCGNVSSWVVCDICSCEDFCKDRYFVVFYC